MLTIKIRRKFILLNFAITLILMGTMLSYFKGEWYFQSGYLMTAPYAKQANYCYFLGSLFLFIVGLLRFRNLYYYSFWTAMIYGFMMFVPALIWCIITVATDGTIASVVMRQYAPFMIIFAGVFILGSDEILFQHTIKLSKYVMIIMVLATIYAELEFLLKFGFSSRSKSSAIYVFYTEAFLSWSFYAFNTQKKRNNIVLRIGTIGLVLAAFLSLSRGNILVATLSYVLCFRYLDYEKKYKWGSYLKIVILILVVILLISQFFPTTIHSLVGRLTDDTRSLQYIEFFSQVSFTDLLVGGGTGATYSFKGNDNYEYFDNAYIVMAFRYGLIPVVGMLLLLLSSIVYAFKKKFSGCWQTVLLWLLVTNGLSVYWNYRISFGYFLIWLSVGKLLAHKSEKCLQYIKYKD